VYEQLADAFAHAKSKVVIAKTDADGVGKPLGNKYEVKGYPSASDRPVSSAMPNETWLPALKWFAGDGSAPEPYEGGRDLEALTALLVCSGSYRNEVC
jgi:protein disulfide-isomerase A6